MLRDYLKEKGTTKDCQGKSAKTNELCLKRSCSRMLKKVNLFPDSVEIAKRMSKTIDNGETVKIIDPGHDGERFRNLTEKFK